MFLNIQIDLLILKTYYGQFTWTTKNHCISSLKRFKELLYSVHDCPLHSVSVRKSTPSPGWNCQWGPSGGRIAYTRAMSEHRCFPKTRLSILIHCISNDITEIYLKMTMSHWKQIMNEDTHLLLMWKVTIGLPVYKVDTHNDRQLDRISTTVDVFCC